MPVDATAACNVPSVFADGSPTSAAGLSCFVSSSDHPDSAHSCQRPLGQRTHRGIGVVVLIRHDVLRRPSRRRPGLLSRVQGDRHRRQIFPAIVCTATTATVSKSTACSHLCTKRNTIIYRSARPTTAFTQSSCCSVVIDAPCGSTIQETRTRFHESCQLGSLERQQQCVFAESTSLRESLHKHMAIAPSYL